MARIDLHIHTALSACAENVMSPRHILERASGAALEIIAITDHNASAHVPLVTELAPAFGIRVIPGMELTTREEVHLLIFFRELDGLMAFQSVVDNALSADPNVADVFGHQLVYDEADEIIDLDEQLRQIGANIGLDETVIEAERHGGIVVPAHVFRYRNSLTSQLGFVDANPVFGALEIARPRWQQEDRKLGDSCEGLPLMTNSDAHYLEDIGRSALDLPTRAEDGIDGVLQALRESVGREA
ncbi:MAG: PHP domain-containing protein [Lentisphaerae bacterium]|jgi:3',5'-nucleoside bisphosphate phosphatase|nr:PHP domain-containing protein [Lentisphaerota bacterium]MBT4819581.1 PHP domain-containing protein [Lentisphaerota bacterium]MBT5609669.1 PHP domain-containing protein [Lentisphaerota bacterium]MBT7059934.1 PHP domain-containing protein [Lentisphaerota bacterium]MBT7841383.1 PHP domain-containing protein [Lentisphaerota bacterium]